MTREEEVEIISERYGANSLMYGKLHNDTLKGLLKHYQEGFVAGVKWADKNPKSPWISVDEDLPCNHKELMSSNPVGYSQETTFVLAFDITGSIVKSMMVNDSGKWEWVRWPALYWMPIPELPKE